MGTIALIIASLALVAALCALAFHFNKKWIPKHKPASHEELQLVTGQLQKQLQKNEEVAKRVEDAVKIKRILREDGTPLYAGNNVFEAVKAYLGFYTPTSVLAEDYATKADMANAALNAVPTDLIARIAALEAKPAAPATAPAALPADVVLTSDLTRLDLKLDKTRSAMQGVIKLLREAWMAEQGMARANLEQEIAKVQGRLNEAQKALKPLQGAVDAAKDKVTKAKRQLLPEKASKQALDRELQTYFRDKGIDQDDLGAVARAQLDYIEAVRPDRVLQAKTELQSAEEALAEANRELEEYKNQEEDTSLDRAELDELRQRLAAIEETEQALVDLEKSVGGSAVTPIRRPTLPAPAPLAAPSPLAPTPVTRPIRERLRASSAAPPRPKSGNGPGRDATMVGLGSHQPIQALAPPPLDDPPDSTPSLRTLQMLSSAPPPPALPTRPCPNCGHSVSSVHQYCQTCGKPTPPLLPV